MTSVPALIVGGFFILVGLLLMPFSLGEGVMILVVGMIPFGIGLAWGAGKSRDPLEAGETAQCPRCGRPNADGSLFCAQCGLYLPLPA